MKRLVRALLALHLLSTSAFAGWSPGGPFQSFNAMPWFYNQPAPAPAPVNLVLPVITGTTQVGQTLTVTPGAWSNSPSSVTEQWLSGGLPIPGATGTTYVPVSGDVGNVISDVETASNTHGSANAVAVPVGPVTASGGAFAGPGSPGFKSNTSAPFSIANNLKGSSDFSTGSAIWTFQGNVSGGSPTVSATLQPAPDGSTTAYQVTFPTVTGTGGKFAVVNQAVAFSGNTAGPPMAFSVWAQVPLVSGAPQTNGTIYATMSVGTTFVRASIPNDGAWHLVQDITSTAQFGFGNAPGPQIGVNLNDAGQAASTGTIVVNLWGASVIDAKFAPYLTPAMFSTGGPLATTSATAAGTVTIPLPKMGNGVQIAMRDFGEASVPTLLLPSTSNPILSGDPTKLYESGGISDPYVNSPMFSGGFYWGFSNADTSLARGNWMSFALWKSTDGLHWTEDTTNAPYLQTFGSQFVAPAINTAGTGYDAGSVLTGHLTYTGTGCSVPLVLNATTNGTGGIASATYVSGVCAIGSWPTASSTAWSASSPLLSGTAAALHVSQTIGTGLATHWQLHPAWLPFGCNVPSGFGAGPHNFCIIYTARTNTNSDAGYLAWSDTVDGVYTMLGCPAAGTCASPTQITTTGSQPGTPSGAAAQNTLFGVVNVGGISGTNYVYASNFGESGPATMLYTTPANPATTGAGSTLTWVNIALPVKVSGADWDFGTGNAYQDNQVILNKCGFYEYFYTGQNGTQFLSTGKEQVIGYAVSNSPTGPWWKYPAPIIPPTSSMYFGAQNLGDSAPISIGGQFLWLGNYDNGTTASQAVAATMPDTCP